MERVLISVIGDTHPHELVPKQKRASFLCAGSSRDSRFHSGVVHYRFVLRGEVARPVRRTGLVSLCGIYSLVWFMSIFTLLVFS